MWQARPRNKRPIRLNRGQVKMLATLCANMAEVSMASVALPYFLDKFDIRLALLGVMGAFAFSIASLLLLKSQP